MAIITELKYQKNQSRVNVYLDGEFACGMELSVILKNGIKVGVEITEERLSKLRIESDFDKAYEKALGLLNRQKYTKKALKAKLKIKGYDNETIEPVIEKLENLGLLSDLDFAQSFIRSSSNKSRRELENALLIKGVSPQVVAEAIASIETSDEDVACSLAEKFMRYKEKSPENIKKLIAYLYRKGFSITIAESIAKNFVDADFWG